MIINMSSGGSAGKIVTVHVFYKSTVNVTCTDGKKTYTGVTDANYNVIFKLPKGIWTITAEQDGYTSSINVNISKDCTINISIFSATIHVTYPAGSSAHVEGPNFWASAPDTSGSWTCTVPAAGDYLVCADNSTTGQGVCKTVTITENGQNESMSLDYVLRLYNAGAFASGQSLVNDSTGTSGIRYTENEDSINIVASNSQGYTYRYFKKPVDLTDKSVVKMTLHSNAAYTESGNLNYTIGASIWADSDTKADWTSPNTRLKRLAANTDYEVSVDVSALSGEYYIWLKFSFTIYSSGKLDIDILSVEVE